MSDSMPDERAPTYRSVRESLSPDVRLALIEERLDNGAKSFSKLEIALEKLQDAVKLKRSPLLVWVLGGGGLTVAMLIGGLIWQAARYPDRAEFKETIERRDAKIEALDERLENSRQEISILKTRLEERDKTQATVADAIKAVGKKVNK